MKSSLFLKELKRNRKLFFIWSGIVIAFTIMVLGIYPSMEGIGDDLTDMMKNIPEGLKRAMGVDEQTWMSILGFYSTYFGIYIVLLTGIYTMSTGTRIISTEEKDKTAEFLMTRPISRNSIFNTKIAALYFLAVGIFALQTIVAVIGMQMASGDAVDWSKFITMHIHGGVLIFFFTALGVLISMLLKPSTNYMGLVFGIIFGLYFLNAISKASESIEWLAYISPFNYLDFNVSGDDYSVHISATIVFLVLSAILVFAARLLFERKDIDD